MSDNFINPTKLAYDEVLNELEKTKNELNEQITNLNQISENLNNSNINSNDEIIQTTENIISMNSILNDSEPTKEEMIAEMQNLERKPLYEILPINGDMSAIMTDSNVKMMSLSSEELINLSKANPVVNKNLF